MRNTKVIIILAAIAVMMSGGGYQALAGPGGYGSLVPRSDVTEAFENYQADPDLNYYFSGSDVWPDALFGLNKAYTLNSPLWRKIEMTPEAMKKLVSGMKARPSSPVLHGFAILDDQGRQIGKWYSILGIQTFIKMENERTVDIHTPINFPKREMNDI